MFFSLYILVQCKVEVITKIALYLNGVRKRRIPAAVTRRKKKKYKGVLR